MAANQLQTGQNRPRERFTTPPRPTDAIEPISPILQPSFDATTLHNITLLLNFPPRHGIEGSKRPRQYTHTRQESGQHARVHENGAAVPASPLDKLSSVASVALGSRNSPTFGSPVQRYPNDLTSPVDPYFGGVNGARIQYPSYPDYKYNQERPPKRARSELLPSPQQLHYSARPSTSWSYNVENAIANGQESQSSSALRNHQGQRYPMQENDSIQDIAETLISLSSKPVRHNSQDLTRHNGSAHQHPPVERPYHEPPTYPQSHEYAAYQHYHPAYYNNNRESEHLYRNEQARMPFDPSESMQAGNGQHVEYPDTLFAGQTHTPPDESSGSSIERVQKDQFQQAPPKKAKGQQGWPKGKPRGPRARGPNTKKAGKPAAKVVKLDTKVASEISNQLQSPRSLPASLTENGSPKPHAFAEDSTTRPTTGEPERSFEEHMSSRRRNSVSNHIASSIDYKDIGHLLRQTSAPPSNNSWKAQPEPAPLELPRKAATKRSKAEQATVCAKCNCTPNSYTLAENQSWMQCNGCKSWYHFECAGFTERQVRNVDKYHCPTCKPTHGPTTFVRKSARAHTAVDYAGLHEGVLRTNDESTEHHYIKGFKENTIKFRPETFPRMPPELVTAEYFERCGVMNEPIVIPAAWNPRPKPLQTPAEHSLGTQSVDDLTPKDIQDVVESPFEYEVTDDVGQDRLGMVIPQGLTVRRVAELYGPEEKVDVIDVKIQEGEDKRWSMRQWADYYEEEGENKKIRNVISLEVSKSKLGRLIQRPQVVRDLDLQDSVWPSDLANPPKVQFYCLMSVADCYTDFHIDFGGSSVYYHILKGKKTFFFIPPTKQHLKKYEDWCLSPAQNHTYLPDQTRECYRVDLSEGDTMLIPSGWIHAVWTPENSLVIGGNFLTRMNYGMQIKILEIEKATKVQIKFRYPFFQRIMWFAVIKYLETDPIPASVVQAFYEGRQFHRAMPTYLEYNKFGHNSDPGPENYHARYYPRGELDGLLELASYIFRTVMIKMGRVEGTTQSVRDAVSKSIPKTHGDPLDVAKKFAMWTAWKRGNEDLVVWAHPDAVLPGTDAAVKAAEKEKKLSVAEIKKLERQEAIAAHRAVFDRPVRQRASTGPSTNGVSGSPGQYTTSPKTSVLGPQRIACDACRHRRIKCKHKQDVLPNGSPSAKNPSDESTSLSPSTTVNDHDQGMKAFGIRGNSLEGVIIMSDVRKVSDPIVTTPTAPAVTFPNGQAVPPAAAPLVASIDTGAMFSSSQPDLAEGKRGRNKACTECRKSKRRCVHDDNGNIDPVKAQEASVPRAPKESKKRRANGDTNRTQPKKKKQDAPPGEDDILPEIAVKPAYLQSGQFQQVAPYPPNMLMSGHSQITPVKNEMVVNSSEPMAAEPMAAESGRLSTSPGLPPVLNSIDYSGHEPETPQQAIDPSLDDMPMPSNGVSHVAHVYQPIVEANRHEHHSVHFDEIELRGNHLQEPSTQANLLPLENHYTNGYNHSNALPASPHAPHAIRVSSPLTSVVSEQFPSPVQDSANQLEVQSPSDVFHANAEHEPDFAVVSPTSPVAKTVEATPRKKSTSRRGSKASAKNEGRATSHVDEGEEESMRLARSLMAELGGLRRRRS
ncbi:hypothetical protein K402DRAFT_356641 [Aulographum hederae CBS 113979]|uniref:JmjC domain-containing histone demethylation protein 1 n=1 Tax=Aulographum hederae CBS 113979 TaxID=1176131 RepID=A0A6G1GXS5_9PEZI|nr:hypothetical protein K402DRAFT_356641 [Aulographum hederae CBS 113979]